MQPPPPGASPTADTLEHRRPAGWPPAGLPSAPAGARGPARGPGGAGGATLAGRAASATPGSPSPTRTAHPAPATAAAADRRAGPLAPAPDARPAPDEGDGQLAPPSVELPAGWGWVVDALGACWTPCPGRPGAGLAGGAARAGPLLGAGPAGVRHPPRRAPPVEPPCGSPSPSGTRPSPGCAAPTGRCWSTPRPS